MEQQNRRYFDPSLQGGMMGKRKKALPNKTTGTAAAAIKTFDQIKTVSDLAAWEQNPNKISPTAAKGLSRSMGRFGDISGITYNLKKNCLVGGHQRIGEIFKQYGPLEIKRIDDDIGKIEAPDGNWWTVRFVNWDDEQHTGAAIAANVDTITGEFTDDLQTLLLDWQPENAADFETLGFDLLLEDSGDDANVSNLKVEQPPEIVWVVAAISVDDFHLISADVEEWRKIEAIQSLITTATESEK